MALDESVDKTTKDRIEDYFYDLNGLYLNRPLIPTNEFSLVAAHNVLIDVELDPDTQERREITLDKLLDKDGLSAVDKNSIINGVLNRLPIAEEVSV